MTPHCTNASCAYQTLDRLFGLFKGIAFGECVAIITTLMAQLYIMLPNTTLAFMTQFCYWSTRTFGGEIMIFVWILIGMLLSWGFDHTGCEVGI